MKLQIPLINFINAFVLAGLVSCSRTQAPAQDVRMMQDAQKRPVDLERPPSIPDMLSGATPRPTPQEAEGQINEIGRQWLYGPGFGRTLTNVGTVVIFPPYVFYLLGNAGLALAGYEPLYVTDILPEAPREQILTVYDSVTSVPGRTAAAIAGEDYAVNDAAVKDAIEPTDQELELSEQK